MYKLILLALLLPFTLALSACSSRTQAPAQNASPNPGAKQAVYTRISPEQAKQRIDSGDAITLVDVRTQSEYDARHIPGAILIPNETIDTEKPESLPDLDAEILVYCRSGARSRQASQKLVDMGYTNVLDMGGINDWPYETVSK